MYKHSKPVHGGLIGEEASIDRLTELCPEGVAEVAGAAERRRLGCTDGGLAVVLHAAQTGCAAAIVLLAPRACGTRRAAAARRVGAVLSVPARVAVGLAAT